MQETLAQLMIIVRKVWLYRRLAICVTVLVCAVGWPVVFALPDVYKAETRVYVDAQSLLTRLLSGLTVDSSDIDAEFLRVARRTLLSQPNLEQIAQETDLHLTAKTEADRERLLQKLAGDIEVRGESTGGKRDNRENLITISYEHKNPQKANAVVSSVLQIFTDNIAGNTRRDTDSSEQFIERQIQDYERKLDEAESRLKDFKRQNSGVMPGDGGSYFTELRTSREKTREARLALQEMERNRDELTRQIKELSVRMGIVDANATESLPPDTMRKIRQVQALEQRLDGLLLQYTDQHPDVMAITDMLTQLRADLGDNIGAGGFAGENNAGSTGELVLPELKVALTKTEAEIASLEARVTEYQSRQETLEDAINTMPVVEAELRKLNRDYDIYRSRYEELVSRRESARMARQAELSNDQVLYQIIDPPKVPTLPEGPNRALFLSFVLALGIAAGAGIAFMASMIRPTFGDLYELRQHTNALVLGRVGLIRTAAQERRHRASYIIYATMLAAVMGAYGTLMMTTLPGTPLSGML